MLDPKRVVCDKNEEGVHKMYEDLGIKCIKVSMNQERHAINIIIRILMTVSGISRICNRCWRFADTVHDERMHAQ